ncbi:type IV pilus assembly protein [delta proteobacterium NaphS2]|nr:type IV pilus assembly protein [delta proteobacterium NaphS2]
MVNNPAEALPIVRLSYKKGDLIIKQGDYGISIYKILEGKVRVTKESEGLEILMSTLGVGDIFGEWTFLNRSTENRSASVRAIEDTVVEVWHMHRLSNEYEKMPPIIKYISDQILSRAIRMDKHIIQLTNQKKRLKEVEKKSNAAKDRRRYYRKKVNLNCKYRPLNAPDESGLEGRIKNISLNGLAMIVNLGKNYDIPGTVGDFFTINGLLPNGLPIELEAKIVSVRKTASSIERVLHMVITEMWGNTRKALGFFLLP